MRTGLADLDFPSFPVRPIYSPGPAEKNSWFQRHGNLLAATALVRRRAAVYILQPPVPDRGMPGAIEMPTANRDD
jgi:hypothetical protein